MCARTHKYKHIKVLVWRSEDNFEGLCSLSTIGSKRQTQVRRLEDTDTH